MALDLVLVADVDQLFFGVVLVLRLAVLLEQVLNFAQYAFVRSALLQVALEILTGLIAFVKRDSAAVHLFGVGFIRRVL